MKRSNLTDRLAYFSNRFANADSALIEEAISEIDRLVADKAELLAALELLLDRVNCGHQRNGPSMIAAREVARAAIAKAKGEAP